MRRSSAARVHAALLGRTDATAVAARERSAALLADCGCAAGAALMTAALVTVVVVAVVRGAFGPLALLFDVLVVVGAAGLGKASGIALAALRLNRLARSVSSSASADLGGDRHVHVH